MRSSNGFRLLRAASGLAFLAATLVTSGARAEGDERPWAIFAHGGPAWPIGIEYEEDIENDVTYDLGYTLGAGAAYGGWHQAALVAEVSRFTWQYSEHAFTPNRKDGRQRGRSTIAFLGAVARLRMPWIWPATYADLGAGLPYQEDDPPGQCGDLFVGYVRAAADFMDVGPVHLGAALGVRTTFRSGGCAQVGIPGPSAIVIWPVTAALTATVKL